MTTTVTVAASYDGIQDNGNITTPPFTVTDFDTLFTVVGGAGSGMFSDDSDFTYLTNTGNVVASNENLWRWPRITFPAIGVPSGARYPGDANRAGVAWRITYRARLSSSNPSGASVASTEPGFVYNDTAYNTGGATFTAYDTTTTGSSFVDLSVRPEAGVDWWSPDITAGDSVVYDYAYFRTDAFRDGAAVFYIRPTYLAHLDMSEIRLTVSWDGAPAGYPPLRQVQRGDGLGIGGTPRAVHQHTLQSTNRLLTSPY